MNYFAAGTHVSERVRPSQRSPNRHEPGRRIPAPDCPEGSLLYAVQLAHQRTSARQTGNRDQKRACIAAAESHRAELLAVPIDDARMSFVRHSASPWDVIYRWVIVAVPSVRVGSP